MVNTEVAELISLATQMMRDRRRVLVLDDDPTGSQTASGAPVVTDFSPESITWLLRNATPTGFVLTNSRSLDAAATRAMTRDILQTANRAATDLGVDLSFLSRSDSTLRGHFPLDVTLINELVPTGKSRLVVVCPAYPAAGRITRDGLHLVRSGENWVPVGETSFAKDATFGFSSSTLPEWVEERSAGEWRAADVAVISLSDIRRGADHVGRLLRRHASPTGSIPVCVDAETEADLDTIAEALESAEKSGVTTIVQCGPSLARARGGLQHSRRLSPADLARSMDSTSDAHGLVVVGSHVGLTTAQLAKADKLDGIVTIELPSAELIDTDRRSSVIESVIRRCTDALAKSDVVLRTSRAVTTGRDAAESLSIAAQIAEALSTVTRAVITAREPKWIIAKGGITSSDVITKVLRMTRARVLGPILDGIVPVWIDQSRSGPLCVVFPGNVGDPDSLRDVITTLREVSR
ncbi:four-carbon acid sugar kinase family protein [Gordonia sp. SL306]|uniref:four-carbon acid sugar kinase family protein n=1 Tax=Gordonia sp. SL306 TaxID=2995145 RepID=UPI00226D9A46|nr:four-carbon acid sugar kinase family protein [Gordonia sp. SL306]WAC56818.1 hypothetical protein OVA31_06090 [Gordonia sp. SL306]